MADECPNDCEGCQSGVCRWCNTCRPAEREHFDGCLTEHTWDEADCNCFREAVAHIEGGS